MRVKGQRYNLYCSLLGEFLGCQKRTSNANCVVGKMVWCVFRSVKVKRDDGSMSAVYNV
jgi:hypothetical protein